LLFGSLATRLFVKRSVLAVKSDDAKKSLLPTGKRITPLATRGAKLESLNPDLPEFANYLAGQAMSTLMDRDGKTLFVLTTGLTASKTTPTRILTLLRTSMFCLRRFESNAA